MGRCDAAWTIMLKHAFKRLLVEYIPIDTAAWLLCTNLPPGTTVGGGGLNHPSGAKSVRGQSVLEKCVTSSLKMTVARFLLRRDPSRDHHSSYVDRLCHMYCT